MFLFTPFRRNWRKSSAKRGLVPTLEGNSPDLRLTAPDQKKKQTNRSQGLLPLPFKA